VNKPKAIILIGPSGSGKSTFAKTLGHNIVSADIYFMREGEYRFDASKLPLAHASCLKRFIYLLMDYADVIVDNPNTTIAEVAPYIAIAQAYGYDVVVKVMRKLPLSECVARATHGNSEDNIWDQMMRIDAMMRTWPRHFPNWVFAHKED